MACQDVSFGTVDMKESLSSCDHGQATQMGAGMSDNTASVGDKVSEIILYLKVTFFYI
jgi:hypothetical protein